MDQTTHGNKLSGSSRYTLIEISAAMSQRQRDLVSPQHPKQSRFLVQDILTYQSDDPRDSQECFVIAMEVLDNLPHDKLVRRRNHPSITNSPSTWHVWNPPSPAASHEAKTRATQNWFQTMVNIDPSTALHETYLPVEDALITRTAELFLAPNDEEKVDRDSQAQQGARHELGAWSSWSAAVKGWYRELSKRSVRRGREIVETPDRNAPHVGVFIPTGAVQFLETLHHVFPKHRLIAADFDFLPAPELTASQILKGHRVPGSILGVKNSPLVASKSVDAKATDHATYLVPEGTADIFFQTDFHSLKNAVSKITSRPRDQVLLYSSRDFLREHAQADQTRTKSGYNPMLQDYENTKFILS